MGSLYALLAIILIIPNTDCLNLPATFIAILALFLDELAEIFYAEEESLMHAIMFIIQGELPAWNMYLSTTVVEVLPIYCSELHTIVLPPLSSAEKPLLDILDSAPALLFWLCHVVPALLASALLQDGVSCNVHITEGICTCKACHHLAVCSFALHWTYDACGFCVYGQTARMVCKRLGAVAMTYTICGWQGTADKSILDLIGMAW